MEYPRAFNAPASSTWRSRGTIAGASAGNSVTPNCSRNSVSSSSFAASPFVPKSVLLRFGLWLRLLGDGSLEQRRYRGFSRELRLGLRRDGIDLGLGFGFGFLSLRVGNELGRRDLALRLARPQA